MSTPDDICNDGASKSNDDVCEMNNMVQNMSITTNNNTTDVNICANCGKEGSDVNNTCNKCKLVMYCNAACKKKHRHKHKKECEEHLRLAAERAAKLHDELLFRQPPKLEEDCPICFLRMPSLVSGFRYQVCCGKMVCSGCYYAANSQIDPKKQLCAFCRIQAPSSNEEILKRTKKRVEAGDPIAIYNQGCDYRDGTDGFLQDTIKALKFWHQAAELGHVHAYSNIASCYDNGRNIVVDQKKARHYYELAAIRGDAVARHKLGLIEEDAGNMDRALKHYMIAAGGGFRKSVDAVQYFFVNGLAMKEDYSKALRAYQTYLDEIKSDQRDKAAAAYEDHKYY